METLEKKLIELSKQYVGSSYLEGNIKDVAESLLELERNFKDEVEDFYDSFPSDVTITWKLEMDYDYNDEKVLYLKAYRYETDEEFKLRVASEKSKEDIVRQRELATLAKLKAKYGDVS